MSIVRHLVNIKVEPLHFGYLLTEEPFHTTRREDTGREEKAENEGVGILPMTGQIIGTRAQGAPGGIQSLFRQASSPIQAIVRGTGGNRCAQGQSLQRSGIRGRRHPTPSR